MTIGQVNAALAKLTRRGDVETLLELNEVRTNPTRAANRDYQRKFKGYYRMRQKSIRFYEVFFTTLQAAAAAQSPPLLVDILQALYNETGERHLSFASKMRATLADDNVIFDKNVANYFRVPSSPLPKSNEWLAKALSRYDRVAEGVQAFIRAANWPQMRRLFDHAFPNAAPFRHQEGRSHYLGLREFLIGLCSAARHSQGLASKPDWCPATMVE